MSQLNPDPVASRPPYPEHPLVLGAIAALEDLKAQDIQVLDVQEKTSITDYMIIASGTSTRHVQSIAEAVQRRLRAAGHPTLGIEGEREAEWVLVDLGDALVHIMLPRMRDLYMLERLWGADSPADDPAASETSGPQQPA